MRSVISETDDGVANPQEHHDEMHFLARTVAGRKDAEE